VSQENVEIVRGLYDRWSDGDFSTREPFDGNVDFARIGGEIVSGPGGPGRWHGRDEMWRANVEWLRLWEEFHIEAEDFIEVDDQVVVLSHQTARGRLSGTPVEKDGADVFTLRDGRIVRWESYSDRQDALKAVGFEE
jgi:ketosteroid isomerase-like protein